MAIRAALRFAAQDIEVDLEHRRLRRAGVEYPLTERESELLAYLAARAGQTVSREELELEVWGLQARARSYAVAVTVRRLRTRLERDPSHPELLHTVPGVGWRLAEPDGAQPIELPGDPSPLPRYLTPGLPRPGELAAVSSALRAGQRLVSLCGPGGIGKTRLAVELASGWTGAVVFVDLTTIGRADGVPKAIRAAVGVPDDAALRVALACREAPLLVLDNAEHVISGVADWVTLRGPHSRGTGTTRTGPISS